MDSSNLTNIALRRMNARFERGSDHLYDFMAQEISGENPDPSTFMQALERRSVLQQAMQAEFKLNEKPIKTVLNDAK